MRDNRQKAVGSPRAWPQALALWRAVIIRQIAAAAVVVCMASGICASQTSKSPASGLPVLPKKGIAKPSGAAGGLRVLDWAGLKSALTYTFDDGNASQVSNYSRLQATGVRMTFFLNLNAGNVATWKQAAQDGHELANHTAHHCRANGTDCAGMYAGSVDAEYDLCNDYIKQSYDVSDVWTAASPYGDTGWDNAASKRFFLNRGVWGGQIAPQDNTDPYNLTIYGPPQGATAGEMDTQIDAAHASGKWVILLFHSLGGDNGYSPINASEVIASIDHAKSAGDIWIDSMVNVGAYWIGQKAVTNATIKRSGTDTMLTWTLPAHFPPGKYVRVTVTGGRLKQGGKQLPWNDAGFYEVALDPGSLTISQ